MNRWSPEQLEEVRKRRMAFYEMYASGKTPTEVARHFGVAVPVAWSGIRAMLKIIEEEAQTKQRKPKPTAPIFWGLPEAQGGEPA